jgi:glycosyltransferase involved in cell wall biosynthesis
MSTKLNNDIFCVIPAFNEANTIKKVISDVKIILNNVVVVDDGSSDQTFKIAKNAGAIVLRHIINRGQGAALQTGNEYSIREGAKIIVHFDADDQFSYTEINDIIKPIINNNSNIVFGSRFLKNKNNLPLFKKIIIYPIARLVNKIFVGSTLSDPQNGFRAMSRHTAKLITIQNDGMAHNSEIQYKAHRLKLRMNEVPVTVKYNQFGQGFFSGRGRSSGGVRIVIDLILSRIMN